jgi:hypothetical protein
MESLLYLVRSIGPDRDMVVVKRFVLGVDMDLTPR